MYKKILSIFTTFTIVLSTLSTLALAVNTNNAEIIVNEVFEDYALNSSPAKLGLSGTDARVVIDSKNNKTAYTKIWGYGGGMSIPITKSADKMVFSFDACLTGAKVSGSILKIGNNKSLLNINSNGMLALEDGYSLGAFADGKWHKYTAVIDFSSKMYTFYIDNKAKVEKWKFNISPVKPTNFDFTFQPSDKEDVTEVYIDNVRAYTGNDILDDNSFPTKQSNIDVMDFTPSSEIKEFNEVFINSVGRNGMGESVAHISKEGAVAEWKAMEDGGIEYLHYKQEGNLDCYSDIKTTASEAMIYVYQADVYIESMTRGYVIVGRAMDSNTYSSLLMINSKNQLCVDTTAVTPVPTGKWITVAIICNQFSGTGDVYLDGNLVRTGVPLQNGGAIPTTVRVGYTGTTGTSVNEVYINRIKLYGGDSLRQLDEPTPPETGDGFISIAENSKKVSDTLDRDMVFMTNCKYYYKDGEKKSYDTSSAYMDENGITMVPISLLDIDDKVSIIDGTINSYNVPKTEKGR